MGLDTFPKSQMLFNHKISIQLQDIDRQASIDIFIIND